MTNKNSKNQLIKKGILQFFVFLFSVAVVYFTGINCIFKKLFGITCPGCGMTRAYLSLFKGDIKSAFEFNPMFWSVPILFLAILRNGKITGRKIADAVIYSLICLGIIILFFSRI